MKTVGYVRVSTDKQADRGVSLDAQAEKIRAMAVVHNAELLEIIVDGGESAKSLNRPGMARLLALVDAGEVQTVIIAKLDRLTRSVKDLCTLLEQFTRRGVALVSVAESLDTGSAAGRLVLNIMTAVSQWEREAIGERTRDAMSHKRTNGERVGNIQFGYRLGADGKHVEPDAAEQAALQEIHHLRHSGHTLRGIAAALNQRAFRTRRGSAWRLEHVARVLKQAKEHASRRCAPKTLERYRELGAYLIRELGDVRMNEMTTSKIQEVIHRLKDYGGRRTEAEPQGRALAPKTVRHIGTLLYTVLSDADRLGVLKIAHPMANRRVLLPKLTKRRPAVLDEGKLRTLFDRARNTRLYPFIVLAAATGCRRGELLALQWTDLEFNTGLLTISKSLEQTRGGLRVKSTKSEEPRQLGVPEWALGVLKEHEAEQNGDRRMFGPNYIDHDLIFCQPDGHYYSPDRLGARVVELMRKVRLRGMSLHSLRHSHASILLSKGVPPAVVSQRLGHADQNITLSIYSHALPADARAAAKVWNDSMAEAIASARPAARSTGTQGPARRTGTD